MKRSLRWITTTWTVLWLVVAARDSHADDLHDDSPHGDSAMSAKQRCALAYEKTQIERARGKLVDARKQALSCSSPSCSTYVTQDCTVWLAELDATLPTVILVATDAAGAAAKAVRVTVDGEALTEPLDGAATPLDPGKHKVRFELGAEVIEQEVTIRGGEKNRRLTATFKSTPPVARPSTAPAAPPLAADRAAKGSGGVPTWAWLSGAGGLASLGVGAAFGVSALEAHRTLVEKCSAAGGDLAHCPESTRAETAPLAGQRDMFRAVALGLGAAGLVGVGAAVLGIVLAPSRSPGPRARFVVAPMGSPSGGGAQWVGRF